MSTSTTPPESPSATPLTVSFTPATQSPASVLRFENKLRRLTRPDTLYFSFWASSESDLERAGLPQLEKTRVPVVPEFTGNTYVDRLTAAFLDRHTFRVLIAPDTLPITPATYYAIAHIDVAASVRAWTRYADNKLPTAYKQAAAFRLVNPNEPDDTVVNIT